MKYPRIDSLLRGGALLVCSTLASAQVAFDPATNVPVGQRPSGLAAGDFSGDGLVDLAVVSDTPDKIELLLGTGACGLGAPVPVFLPGGSSPSDIVSGDFDGDGDLDLAVGLKDLDQVRLLVNAGNGVFTLGASGTTGQRPERLATADLDGDGIPDLAVTNRDSDDVSILLARGGVLIGAGTYSAGQRPAGVALGDVTGDALADLVVASHDTREIHVRANLGGGLFGAATVLSVGGQLRPTGVTLADVDGDGDRDLIAATSGNGLNFLSLFVNQGGGVFAGPLNIATGGTNPDTVVAADLDGDGDLDLAVTNQDSNSLAVFENLGGTFGAAQILATGVRPGALLAVDLGPNGGVDLVASNRDSNSLSLFCNQNAGGGAILYCVTSPNSAGAGAQIGSSGSLSIAANSFTVTVTNAIAGDQGLFFFGSVQTQVPFGNGVRCVTGVLTRLDPPQLAGPGGSSSRAVDFTAAGSAIVAGSTWNFQYWYRDPAAGGAGFNLSNGLSVTFLP